MNTAQEIRKKQKRRPKVETVEEEPDKQQRIKETQQSHVSACL